MFEIKNPTKRLKTICKELGSSYSITAIDGEQVIYHKINDVYDVEISGLNNNRQSFNPTVYVWQISPALHTVETIKDIKSLESLKSCLNQLEEKYHNLN